MTLAPIRKKPLVQKVNKKVKGLFIRQANRFFSRRKKWIYRRQGIYVFDEVQTHAYLKPFQLVTHPAHSLNLPEVVNSHNPSTICFKAEQPQTNPVSVWYFQAPPGGAEQLPYGGVLVQNHLLCTDTNTDDFYRNSLQWTKRIPLHTNTLVALWSHYLDGFVWGGYYDFVLLVLGKLCRIKEDLPPNTFSEAFIAYPLFNTAYEREYLALLGINPSHVLDSRTVKVHFEQCVLANTGHWFYPNKADITALRKYILPHFPIVHSTRNRVYISRAGRRSILNEEEVITLLKGYDFQILEDKPRTVAEQVAIYQQAEFIIGPHGASFVNILWCQPGTHLFELFSPTYCPDFFRNLAIQLGLQYSAYVHGQAETADWAAGLEDDIYVSVQDLKKCLDTLLSN